jgi:DNA invertase Pin-like site-specific DNA recombinase
MKPDLRGMRTDRLRKPKAQAQKTGALIYCRVSTKEQGENLSLPVQERKCQEYCKAQGWEVLKVFRDKESAKTISRTEFAEMLEFCVANHKQIAAVVFYDTTRFSRETVDYHTVRAHPEIEGDSDPRRDTSLR